MSPLDPELAGTVAGAISCVQTAPRSFTLAEVRERYEGRGRALDIFGTVPEWELTLPVEPVAKGRPKFTAVGGFARAYTPAKTRRFEDVVRQLVAQHWRRPPLEAQAVSLLIDCVRPVPASWSKRKTADALSGRLMPTSKPDLDNLVKSVVDGMAAICFRDDSIIVRTLSVKRYGERPSVTVAVWWHDAPPSPTK